MKGLTITGIMARDLVSLRFIVNLFIVWRGDFCVGVITCLAKCAFCCFSSYS